MALRLRFRVRTYLVAVALVGLPLYGTIEILRHGGVRRFRVHHAVLARDYGLATALPRRGLERYSKHLTHRVPCPTCQYLARRPAEAVAEYRLLIWDLECRAWWHRLLSWNWEYLGGAET